jgi:hypothetical protein
MSSIKFSQLPQLANIPADAIFPIVSSGTNYKVSLNSIKTAVALTPGWTEITGKPNFATVAFSGLYQDLSGKPTIPTVPTNISAFTNDRGYLTSVDYGSVTNTPQLAAVATSGNWLDIVNKPAWFNTTATGYLYSDGSGTLSFQAVQGGSGNSRPWELSSSTSLITLTTDGNLVPATDIQQDLGSPTNRFRHVYVSSGTIYLGDVTISEINGQLIATNTVTNKVISLTDTTTRINANNAALVWNDDAVLEFPGNTVYIKAANSPFYSNFYVDGGNNETGVTGMPNQPIRLHTYTNSGSLVHKYWYFNSNGTITFPDGSTQVTAGGLLQASTAPTGTTSTIWYDTLGGRTYVYYESTWVDASPVQAVDTTQLVNGSYSVTLGVDGYLNLPNGLDGAGALIQSPSPIRINSNGNFWQFGADGNLTIPGAVITPYGSLGGQGVDTLVLGAGTGKGAQIQVNNGTIGWAFGTNGSITFPDSTVQSTAFTATAYISKATLKSIVAASTNFTDFQARIAAL